MIYLNRKGYLAGVTSGGQNLNQFVFHEYLWVLEGRLKLPDFEPARRERCGLPQISGAQRSRATYFAIAFYRDPVDGGSDSLLGVDDYGNATATWQPRRKDQLFTQSYLMGKGWQAPRIDLRRSVRLAQISVGQNGDMAVAWISGKCRSLA